MKKVLGFILISFFALGHLSAGSYASAAKVKVEGIYEIDIVGTPEGDFHVFMTVKEADDKWNTELESENIKITAYRTTVNENKVTVNFTYEGESIWFDLEIDGDEIKGWANDSWKITGKRVKKKA